MIILTKLEDLPLLLMKMLIGEMVFRLEHKDFCEVLVLINKKLGEQIEKDKQDKEGL